MINKVISFLFEKPDHNSSDMTVFYGWEIVFFIICVLVISILLSSFFYLVL